MARRRAKGSSYSLPPANAKAADTEMSSKAEMLKAHRFGSKASPSKKAASRAAVSKFGHKK